MLKSGHATSLLKTLQYLVTDLRKKQRLHITDYKVFQGLVSVDDSWFHLFLLSPGFLLSTCVDIFSLASGPWPVAVLCLKYLFPQLSLIRLLLQALAYKPALTPQIPLLCLYSTLCTHLSASIIICMSSLESRGWLYLAHYPSYQWGTWHIALPQQMGYIFGLG